MRIHLYRLLPTSTDFYRPQAQQVQRPVTRTDRPHQHRYRGPALARRADQCVALEHRVYGEGPDAEDVMTAHEQGRSGDVVTRRPQPTHQSTDGVSHLPRPLAPDRGTDSGLDAM